MTVQCCKCLLVRKDDVWERWDTPVPKDTSHSYCPACYEETMEEIRAQRARTDSSTPAVA